jgi:O-antigen/teichoic acid export membrane protein
LQHLGWILSGKGYGAVLSLIYLSIITHSLGPAGYGAFALVLGTVAMLQLVLSFNIWQVLIKYGHEHINAQNDLGLFRLIRFCTVIDIVTAAMGTVAVGLILWLGRARLGIADELAWIAFAYAAMMMFSVRNVPRGILRLQHQFRLAALAEAVVPTVKLTGSLLALLVEPTLGMFLLVWSVGELLSTVVFWGLAARQLRRSYDAPVVGAWRRAWRENEGLPAMLLASNVGESAYAVGHQLPTLLVGSFAGVAEAGLYRLAHQLTQTISLLGGLINLASFTEMAHVFAKEGLGKTMSLFIKLTLVALGIVAVIAPVIIFLGKPILLLMSGPQFIGAYPFLLVLGLSACLQIISVSCEPLLLSVGRPRTLITIRLIGTAVLLIAMYAMLEYMGAIGAAWARVAADIVTLCLMFGASIYVLRKIRTKI